MFLGIGISICFIALTGENEDVVRSPLGKHPGLTVGIGEGKDFGIAYGLKEKVAACLGAAAFDAQVVAGDQGDVAPGLEFGAMVDGVLLSVGLALAGE